MKLLGATALQDREDQFVFLFDAQHGKAFYEDDRPWCNRTRGGTISSMPMPSPKHALDPTLVALGNAIRSSRQAVGISKEELAHRSKVDRSYMSSVERGMQNLGVMTLVQIASANGISAAELVGRAEL